MLLALTGTKFYTIEDKNAVLKIYRMTQSIYDYLRMEILMLSSHINAYIYIVYLKYLIYILFRLYALNLLHSNKKLLQK